MWIIEIEMIHFVGSHVSFNQKIGSSKNHSVASKFFKAVIQKLLRQAHKVNYQ